MLTIKSCRFEDLSAEEKEEVPNNGHGKEYAGYIRIQHHGETVLLKSDAMEKEDATFSRDLNWIYDACRKCYEFGKRGEECLTKK